MEPKFENGQKVMITGNQKTGTVIGRWDELGGAWQYLVRYFDNEGRARSTWFYAPELEEVAAAG